MTTGGIIALNTAETDPRQQNFAIRQLMEGRSNATGVFTLTAGTTATTVTAVNCAEGSTVLPFQTTANAAAEIGNGTMYIGTVSNGSFVVTHVSAASTDRTFRFACFG